MYKIAISGKANSGKSTVGELLFKELKGNENWKPNLVAFADPIKEIVMKMFPIIPEEHLFGPSEFRNNVVPNAFKNGNPLTIRTLLHDIGTELGRSYNKNIWLDVFDFTFNNLKNKNAPIIIVSDVRFLNEFNHLKNLNFTKIRVVRKEQLTLNHSSETDQESISDNEFDYVIHNDFSMDELKLKIKKIANHLKS